MAIIGEIFITFEGKVIAWLKLHRQNLIQFAFFALLFAGLFYALYRFYGDIPNDWQRFFGHVANNIRQPSQVKGFINPPWTAIFLLYGLLPLKVSNVINLLLNITVLMLAVRKVGGGRIGLLLTFTSPLFFDMARVNPIDWIPLFGFLLPPMWGFPLMATKPQTLGAAMFIKWKKEKFSIKTLLPLLIIVAVSFILWGNWVNVSGTAAVINTPWNFSFWPLGIPFGIYLLYRAYKTEDEVLAGAATFLLVPYAAPYSMTCLLALLSGKHRKIAFTLYLVSYWFVVVEMRRTGIQLPTLF